MSKIELSVKGIKVADIENKLNEINDHFILVDKKYLNELQKNNIEPLTFPEGFFIVKQGKKNKKFNEEQQKKIREELQNGLSIRKCANKYNCSTRTIQNIKQNKY